jgi:transcription antitermination factor NusG
METLKNLLTERNAEPFAFLSSGRQVRFIHGPLQGLKGVIVRRRGRLRAVVSIDWIMRSVIVDVEASDLAPSDS